MCALKISLWVAGVFFLLGAAGMLLPDPTWVSIVEFFGVESSALTASPLAEYMLRTGLAMAAVIGVFLIVLALNPAKYPALILFTGLALLFLGLACAASGLAAAMPAVWFLSDSLSCVLLGILILVFRQKAKLSLTKKESRQDTVN